MTYENVVLEVETQTALNEVSSAVNTTEIEESVSVEIKEEAVALISTVQTIAAAPLPTTTKVVQVTAAIKKFENKTGAKVTKAKVTSQPAVTTTNIVQSSKVVTQKATTIAKQIIQSTTKKETINEKEEKQEEKKSEIKTEEKEKKQETKKIVSAKEETSQEEESSSTTTSTEVVSTKGDSEQKKVQSEKVKANIRAIMAKVDEQVKDIAKNLEVKNLIKLDAMVSDQASLDLYNVPFYIPKDIYLDQLPLIDNRIIYGGITLSNYIVNDKVFIKEQKLNELNLRKQRLLMEIRELKNG